MSNSVLTAGQTAVLRAFHEFGPMTDVALSVYVHHVEEVSMSSSGIRSRRAELARATSSRGPLLHAVGTKKLKSGRRAAVHALTDEGKLLAELAFGSPTTSTGVSTWL